MWFHQECWEKTLSTFCKNTLFKVICAGVGALETVGSRHPEDTKKVMRSLAWRCKLRTMYSFAMVGRCGLTRSSLSEFTFSLLPSLPVVVLWWNSLDGVYASLIKHSLCNFLIKFLEIKFELSPCDQWRGSKSGEKSGSAVAVGYDGVWLCRAESCSPAVL